MEKRRRQGHARRARGEQGQVALLFGLMLVVLLALVALAIDGGNLYLVRRELQAMADLAAISGAQRLYDGNIADAIADAQGYATLNGGPEATVSVPPTDGPHAGDEHYVQVSIERTTGTFFASILGVSQVNVTARAVARAGRDTPPYALLALTRTQSPGIDFGGGNTIRINDAGVMSNSGVSPSIRQSSSSGLVQADGPINAVGPIVGNYDAPVVRSGVPLYPDPLANMPPPTFGAPGTDQPTTRHGTQTRPQTLVMPASGDPLPGSVTAGQPDSYTFGPGVYWGGIQIAGGRYTMSPGIYVMAGGGLAVTGGSLTGSGIFIYNTNDPRPGGGTYGGANGDFGPISLTTNQGVELYASHVPLYLGMAGNVLIFQDRNATDAQDAMGIQAVGNTNLYGTLYLPTNGISIMGGGSAGVAHGQIIVNTAAFGGSNTAGITYDSNWAIVPPGSTLVE